MNGTTSIKPNRIASIDVFRALTMFFMVFVNDFWTVTGVPHWLEHAAAGEDFLGFSDLIFPSFLFVLGMSIPYAIEGRIAKGESKQTIMKHILLRTVALLVMGLFTVNIEAGISESTGLSREAFTLITVAAFFLIWNVYPKSSNGLKYLFSALKGIGILLLICLAFLFRDAEGGILSPRWWGILGLIGWTYLLCASIYLFIRQNRMGEWIAWVFFVLLCIAGSNRWLGFFQDLIPGNGVFHAFTMGGLIISLLLSKWQAEKLELSKMVILCILMSIVLLLMGWLSHFFWIISKIAGTPGWMFFCLGITILLYILVYWLVDIKKKNAWFDGIRPAGSSTLTCYLVPYLLYSIFSIIHFTFPGNWLVGIAGLLKCVAFSFLAIGITFLLGKIGIKLKI